MGRKNKSPTVSSRQSHTKPKRKDQQQQHNLNHNNNRELHDLVDKLLRISTIPQQQNVTKSLENQREIANITDKVKTLEINKNIDAAGNVAGDVTDKEQSRAGSATVGAFTKWAFENGAELHGCRIREFPGYDLGLEAEVDVPKSSLVIAVPRSLMLSIEKAHQSHLKLLIEKDKILGSMPNVTLAMFLLFEKFKGDSFWKPYIDILPRTYTTVLYFNMEELEELKGSPTLEIALRQIKSITRQYAYFHKLFATSDDPVSRIMRDKFTYQEYCWAVSTVMTRQNTIPFQEDYYALIPLWDLCNHANGTISTAYNPVLDRSECLALQDFKKGEQLFIFYGGRNNADLFIHNGFVYEDNNYDSYWIRLGVSKSDPLREKRTQLLSKLSIPPTTEFSIYKGAPPLRGALLAFVRAFSMNSDQLDHWIKSDKSSDLEHIDCALDTDLEKKSWTFLEARFRLVLASYPTTLERDLAILTEGKLTANGLLAVRMRTTEKRLIKEALEYVQQYLRP